MDLHRLEIFCKVVELKSFTLAAEALNLSQPTVSEHLRSLEEMAGDKLVDRSGRELRLTPAGQVLLRYAQKLLHLRDEAQQALADLRGELWGRLTIGASTIPGSYLVPQVIGAFKAQHPAIHITLKIANTAAVAEMVLKGDSGLGLVGSRLPEKRLQFVEVYLDELTLAVAPHHPWAKRQEVDLRELYSQPYILRERGSGTQMAVREILGAHGLDFGKLTVAAEMPNTEAVRQAIKAGVGISILSRLAVAAELNHGDLVAVKIRDVELRRPLFLVQRQGRPLPLIYSTFSDLLRQTAARLQSEG
ncbi:MAG: selenium metabolism-associated LysR family transcriptional regulator [Desulfobacca sp.]|uniref:selenium metabolism-associated LysR family transcriptional regulator n=1 Tax=Desulfobacca sp. TaxID=2067990 RepID=UPI0040493144